MEFALPKSHPNIIKAIGVGGGGSNAVNNMFLQGIRGVDCVIANTDAKHLDMLSVPLKIRLGINQTEGLGAGSDPMIGKISAQESAEEFREMLKENTKMVFITAGMGGGTGTGAAPVLAGIAKSMNVLTVGIVTTPFDFEGPERLVNALAGVEEMKKNVDTLLIISNGRLTSMFEDEITFDSAFVHADKVLCDAARGIAEVIDSGGYINADFADVRAVMKDAGTALMGTAVRSGENRAVEAAEAAIYCPLLNNSDIQGAKRILVNVTAAKETFKLKEFQIINQFIRQQSGPDVFMKFGVVYNPEMEDKLSVTVIATGFNENEINSKVQAETRKISLEITNKTETVVKPIEKIVATTVAALEPGEQITMKLKEDNTEKKSSTRGSKKIFTTDRPRYGENNSPYTKPQENSDLEKVPAYKRRGIDIKAPQLQNEEISKYYLEEEKDGEENGETYNGENDNPAKGGAGKSVRLKEGNPFLHDNVD